MIEWFIALSFHAQVLVVLAFILWLPTGWVSALFWSKIQSGEWTPLELCQAERPTWRVFLYAYLGPIPLVVGIIFLCFLWAGYYLKGSPGAGHCETR